MRDMPDSLGFDEVVRAAWAALIRDILPAAARGRNWPVGSPAGFERILLDHVLGAPWESLVAAPSGCNADPLDLVLAIEMGERLAAGSASISDLNRRSLALRANRTGTARGACDGCGPPSVSEDDAAALMQRAIASARAERRRA
jgi:hypothetical protein